MRALGICAYKTRLWWLWLVCSYRFRWAHRPICLRFRRGVIRLGGVYLCRSCMCAYGGMLVCVLSLILLKPSAATAGVTLAALGAPTLAMSGPWCYKRLPRVVQDLLRLAMGATIVLCGYLVLRREFVRGLAAAVVLFVFWRAYLKVRRRRRLHACDGCAELSQEGVCSGCQLQAEGIRRYEETATQLYLASGQTPRLSFQKGVRT